MNGIALTKILLLALVLASPAVAQNDAAPARVLTYTFNLEWGDLFPGGDEGDSLTVLQLDAPAYIERAWIVADTACTGLDSLHFRLREQQLPIISYSPLELPENGLILQEWAGWKVESDDAVTLQLFNAAVVTGQVRLFLKIQELY